MDSLIVKRLGCCFVALWLLAAPARPLHAQAGVDRLPPRTFANLAEKVSPAIVTIEVLAHYSLPFDRNDLGEEAFYERLGAWATLHPEFEVTEEGFYTPRSGSGVVIRADGYILSSWHLLEGRGPRDVVRVSFNNGDKYEGSQVTVVGGDPLTDLVVLRVSARNLPTVGWGNSRDARPGDWVMVVGNPLDFEFSVSEGIISGKNRQVGSKVQIERLLQTTAMINPGSSGGAMVSLDGNLLGIVMAMASRSNAWQGLGFAIPEEIARPVAEHLIDFGYVKRGFLGILMEPITRFAARSRRLPQVDGVRITRFYDGFPAQRAGLRVDDIIVAVEGSDVKLASDVLREVGTRFAGEKVTLSVMRPEGRTQVQVTLTEAPSEEKLENLLRDLARAEPNPADLFPPSEPEGTRAEPDIIGLLGLRVLPRPSGEAGLVVLRVQPGSAAARAGLNDGDLLKTLDGESLTRIGRLRDLLLGAEGAVQLEAERGGKTIKLRMVLPGKIE